MSMVWTVLCALKDPYQNNPIRIVLEILLLGVVLRYAFSRRGNGVDSEIVLSDGEAEQLIAEWEPKELGEEVAEPEIGKVKYVLSSFTPFLFNGGSLGDEPVAGLPGETVENRMRKKKEIKAVVDKYGVGTCGPRGFYGTLDVQLDLEAALAQSLGVEGVVLYAHALLAIASVIKCFCKRSDVIFYDYRSSVSIRRGIYASKAKAISYTTPSDLNAKLSLEKASRMFIITEGIFEETGETADLGAVVRTKQAHKAFLILDESISIPMLGTRGSVGFFGIDPAEIDLWIGSLAGGYESAGGFCGSTRVNSDQQRLCSLAYCFSASLPAALTCFGLANIETVAAWEAAADPGLVVSSEEESSSECEFSYAPEIEFPVRRPSRSPKFARRFCREKNTLINSPAVAALVRNFNQCAKKTGVSIRARNDSFTPIVRLVIQEETAEKSFLIQHAYTLLLAQGIFVRTTQFPEPALLLIVDNSITPATANTISLALYAIMAEVLTAHDQNEATHK
ncbi:serine palmitoyltransferase [Nematocida homosporus]|uniref:serine palmitoyltransferase n=1 Tax=Nematocida homosporus TaxID=1912981 RepID=UPI002220290E|nr:serine palmitoyltransferase [Nematocida homosporus]KAI5184389.1 serine palmitoyltransferase [Nematocida homosporus]